jgi:hypothetical protein
MKPSRVSEILGQVFDTPWPVFLWGPPGVGKSSIVRTLGATRNVPVIDIRAALLDPTDLRGIPAIVDQRAVWCPPSFLPRPEDPPGILFFDELSAAPPLVQASLYQLTLDRRVGEYVLPDGWRIIAAGNRAQDGSISFRMPAALSNRFVHVEFEVDFHDWRNWAVQAGIHPLVLGFLSTRRELLFDMKTSTDRGFPTPRSWTMASDVLRGIGSWRGITDVLIGVVGEGATMEFIAFCEDALSEEAIKAIIDDPENASLPTRLSDQYALISYVVGAIDDKEVMKAAGHLANRLPPEFAVLLVRDVLRLRPKFVTNSGYRRFVETHGQLLV